MDRGARVLILPVPHYTVLNRSMVSAAAPLLNELLSGMCREGVIECREYSLAEVYVRGVKRVQGRYGVRVTLRLAPKARVANALLARVPLFEAAVYTVMVGAEPEDAWRAYVSGNVEWVRDVLRGVSVDKLVDFRAFLDAFERLTYVVARERGARSAAAYKAVYAWKRRHGHKLSELRAVAALVLDEPLIDVNADSCMYRIVAAHAKHEIRRPWRYSIYCGDDSDMIYLVPSPLDVSSGPAYMLGVYGKVVVVARLPDADIGVEPARPDGILLVDTSRIEKPFLTLYAKR